MNNLYTFSVSKLYCLGAGLSEPKAMVGPGFIRRVGVVWGGVGGGRFILSQSFSGNKPEPEDSESETTT